jgi:hypothetical protein
VFVKVNELLKSFISRLLCALLNIGINNNNIKLTNSINLNLLFITDLIFMFLILSIAELVYEIVLLKLPHNVLRAGDRNPVLRLRQGYGA